MRRQRNEEVPAPNEEVVVKKRKKTGIDKEQLKREEEENTKQFFQLEPDKQFDFSSTKLKPDHHLRPLYVLPNNVIILETFSPIYREAYDFCVAIAEPVSRPVHMHQYRITVYSLYAAVSIGLETKDIIRVLDKLSKVELHKDVVKFIRDCTSSYGKVKLVLESSTYFVESLDPANLKKLLEDTIIRDASIFYPFSEQEPNKIYHERVVDKETGLLKRFRTSDEGNSFIEATRNNVEGALGSKINSETLPDELKKLKQIRAKDLLSEVDDAIMSKMESKQTADEEEEDNEEDLSTVKITDQAEAPKPYYSFEIQPEKVEFVKKQSRALNLPMLEEYDFRKDTRAEVPTLKIDLKPTTTIRNYQEKSLSKMFGNGRGRSGIIVLPCGAGKTLVGITATCTVKKATLVLCINTVSVDQWKRQFLTWTDIPEDRIKVITSEIKEPLSTDGADIVITNYSMISYSGHRGEGGQKIIESIKNREWGLLVLDEVHVAPADTFRKVIGIVKAHCSLGLTATLLREDNRTEDLFFLIGPKLYEANWLDLQSNGHLARVQCCEVWCPMSPLFYTEYIGGTPPTKKLLYVMNPNKFKACEHLIREHEARGDKIIVFSDNVFALKEYAKLLGKHFIYGEVTQQERLDIFHKFQHDPKVKTIFVSKVGDTAIDLPEASVIIQISSHYGSRRQEAQRLGRILRPKKDQTQSLGINAFFYSLVAQDTQEMYYSTKRQQFLIDQGYSFRILTNIHEKNTHPSFYKNVEEEKKMLEVILSQDESSATTEVVKAIDDEMSDMRSRRNPNSIRTMAGQDEALYSESKKRQTKLRHHPIFRKSLQSIDKKTKK